MKYGLIITERTAVERQPEDPIHWLKRYTLDRVLNSKADDLGLHVVETMYPVFSSKPIPEGGSARYEVMMQHVRRADLLELPDAAGPYIEATAQFFRKSREFFGIA